MKNVYINVVFVTEENGKFWAIPERIRAGNNLIPFVNRYNCHICHLCNSATQAHQLAEIWNQSYKDNGTSLY